MIRKWLLIFLLFVYCFKLKIKYKSYSFREEYWKKNKKTRKDTYGRPLDCVWLIHTHDTDFWRHNTSKEMNMNSTEWYSTISDGRACIVDAYTFILIFSVYLYWRILQINLCYERRWWLTTSMTMPIVTISVENEMIIVDAILGRVGRWDW